MNRLSLAAAAGVLAAMAAPLFALAQTNLGWQTYVDPEFGMSISYPAGILPRQTESADGVIFSGEDAILEVSGIEMPDVRTSTDLRRAISTAPGYENVTYSPRGDRWLVLSGYRGSDIFYEKFFVIDGTIVGFSFQYPEAERRFYDPLVEAMEDSFRTPS